MPNKINVSFHINCMPTPFSMMPLIMMMNHFAGMILLIACNGSGILEIGKIKPDSSITGSINPINEIIMAVCCVAEMVEIKIPKANAEMINKILSNANKNRLP